MIAILVMGVPHLESADPIAIERPNIVLFLADDLGFGDLGCYGNTEIRTPHIDALAASGLRFTDFHSNGVVCSPTRAALLTGRYQQRSGITGVVTAAAHRHTGLASEEITFAEALKTEGYRTALFGKWHLGYEARFNPVRQGFDEFVGYVSGNVDYHAHVDQAGHEDWWKQDRLEPETGYVTDLITDHALEFVERHRTTPFCLYLPHESPHYPYQGRNDRPDRRVSETVDWKVQGRREDKREAYREMVEALDDGVGRVVAKLRELGLERKTLVVFTSDNGATRIGSNGRLRGHKGELFEGGHRVPAIFSWPGRIAPGVSEELALGMDLFPTIVALARTSARAGPGEVIGGPIDGIDLGPLLLQGQPLPARIACWESRRSAAMREGDWKLILDRGAADEVRTSLYNLREDLAETRDRSDEKDERVRSMRTRLEAWQREVSRGVAKRS